MEKEEIALLSAKRYYSAITGFEEDPYLAEDAAEYRKETYEYIKSVKDNKLKSEILMIIENSDKFLVKNKRAIIKRLSAISDMDEEDIKYLESIEYKKVLME